MNAGTFRPLIARAAFVLVLVSLPAGAQQLDDASLSRLPWRAIGPAVMGGRIDDVAVDERNPSVICAAAASDVRKELVGPSRS